MLRVTLIAGAALTVALGIVPGSVTAEAIEPCTGEVIGGKCYSWSGTTFSQQTQVTDASTIQKFKLKKKAYKAISKSNGGAPGGEGSTASDSGGGDQASSQGDSGGSGQAPEDNCIYRVVTDPGQVKLAGHNGKKGFLVRPSCPSSITQGGTGDGTINYQDQDAQYVQYATPGNPQPQAPPPPPPPRAEDLALTAIAELPVPAPAPSIGPDDPDRVIVHKPIWLWTDDPGELTTTVSLLGVEVTAVARLAKTSWTMGEDGPEPVDTGVICEGAGAAAPPTADLPTNPLEWEPACGYAYTWKSTDERTDGVGRWPVHVDAEWDVTWKSNTGVSGGTTITTGADTSVKVHEIRTSLVAGDN